MFGGRSGVGSVLQQKVDDHWRLVSFSKKLTSMEIRYSIFAPDIRFAKERHVRSSSGFYSSSGERLANVNVDSNGPLFLCEEHPSFVD